MRKDNLIFILIWLLWGLAAFLPDDPGNLRYANALGTSISLVLFTSFLISKLNWKFIIISLLIILLSNLSLITKYNASGSILEVNPQGDMFLTQEKKAMDYIYKEAKGESFSVNAITIPYNVKTTWSYLFEWYGQDNYGYLPVWAGHPADGFEGNLVNLTKRSEGPTLHFLIVEPGRGLHEGLLKIYIDEENIFTKSVEERSFGKIRVQKRLRI